MPKKSTRASTTVEREEFEQGVAVGTDTSWALRSVLWGYGNVNRHIAKRLDLGVNDVAAIEHLMERPDLGPAELADLLGMRTASATALVDRLEKAGHVERHPHPTDRRRRVLVVTPHAIGEVHDVLMPLFEDLMAIDDGFDASERAAIARYLRRVASVYDDFVDDG